MVFRQTLDQRAGQQGDRRFGFGHAEAFLVGRELVHHQQQRGGDRSARLGLTIVRGLLHEAAEAAGELVQQFRAPAGAAGGGEAFGQGCRHHGDGLDRHWQAGPRLDQYFQLRLVVLVAADQTGDDRSEDSFGPDQVDFPAVRRCRARGARGAGYRGPAGRSASLTTSRNERPFRAAGAATPRSAARAALAPMKKPSRR